MACLDENTITSYLGRRLDPEATAQAEAHLAECDLCRQLVDEVAFAFAASVDAQATRPSPDEPIAPGHIIDRYVILRPLGAGAFGVVYAAYDPELDRKVALKFLRARPVNDDPESRARVLREARAMARLSHPHVTSVYDVHLDGDRLWIAMEFIPGQTMASWLTESSRSTKDILQAFTQAGRGLAAAHDAGLVHGDFKPANVLVANDGKVSVTDFGLARIVPTPDRPPAEELLDAPRAIRAGTPRYMAPEQHAAHEVSPHADQFSFAVALYEALCKAHPFVGSNPQELVQSLKTNRRQPKPPALRPYWLRRILDRALSIDPDRRFASMTDLVNALSVDRRRRHQRRRAVVAAAVLLAAVPAARVYDTHRREASLCKGGPEAVHRVWNPAVQSQLAEQIRPLLHDYFARWQTQFTEVCEATRLRGEMSDRAMTARMLCLDRKRSEAATLIEELVRPAVSARPVDAVLALTPLEDCTDVAALLAPQTPPLRIQKAVESVQRTLAEAQAIRNTGQLDRAQQTVQTALSVARTLDHAPLLAEALLSKARGQALAGRFDDAVQTLEAVIEHAARGHHDRVAAEAWIERVYVGGALQDHEALVLALAPAASAALWRTGDPPQLRARLNSTLGFILAAHGKLLDARQHHERALKAYADLAQPPGPALGLEYHRLAEVLAELGFIREAQTAAERAREILETWYGPHHPRLALPLEILARVDCADGRLRACATKARRAMTVRVQAGDPEDHPAFLPKLLILATAAPPDKRAPLLKAALHLAQTHFGASSAWYGRVLLAQGHQEAGIKLLQENLPPHHPDRAEAEGQLETLATTVGADSPRLVPLLLADGQLDRALALVDAGGQAQRAEAWFAKAKIRSDHRAAQAALAHWQAVHQPEKAREVARWLEAHPASATPASMR